MNVAYDKYYQTEDLFGAAYPELIEFFGSIKEKGRVLDLGCGQGRDAIPLARLGYAVTGVDISKVGIDQMNKVAEAERLDLRGIVADIFEFEDFDNYDFILLDSMFHFTRNDRKKEVQFIRNIVSGAKIGCVLVVCIQDTGKKVEILKEALDPETKLDHLLDQKFSYKFEDKESGHHSTSDYQMIVVRK